EAIKSITTLEGLENVVITENEITFKDINGIAIKCYLSSSENAGFRLFETTGSEKHVNEVKSLLNQNQFKTEEDLYQTAGLKYIEPELREGHKEIELAKADKLPS